MSTDKSHPQMTRISQIGLNGFHLRQAAPSAEEYVFYPRSSVSIRG